MKTVSKRDCRSQKRYLLQVLPSETGIVTRKQIITANYYTTLNSTEKLEKDKDHIMVKVQLHGDNEIVNINAIIDTVATEGFINK